MKTVIILLTWNFYIFQQLVVESIKLITDTKTFLHMQVPIFLIFDK